MSGISHATQIPFTHTPTISLAGKGKVVEPIIYEINQLFANQCIANLRRGEEVSFCFYNTYSVAVSDLSSTSRNYLAALGTPNATVKAPVNCQNTLDRIRAAFNREIPGKKLVTSPILGNNICEYSSDESTLEGYKCVLIDLSGEHKKK